jgi:Flp pilus assembly protein TadB
MRLLAVAGSALSAMAAWWLLAPAPDVWRVHRLTFGRVATGAARDGRQPAPPRAPVAESAWTRWVVAGLAGFAVAVLVGGWAGIVAGAIAAVGGYRWLDGMETTARRRARLLVARDLPLVAELLAAALHAGVPLGRAVDAVAEALGGPLGHRLMTCRRAEAHGVEPPPAWQPLTADPTTAGLGRLMVESAVRGTAPAAALAALAMDLRTSARLAADAAARSVGARVAAPLGLCFLPAFLLLGVVPLVAAAASALVP